jgi:single-stranded DNA-binding protein
VDKDGVNKYITEILADTMLVLEKKQQAAGYNIPPEQGKNDLNGRQVNEPGGNYAQASGKTGAGREVPPESFPETDSFSVPGSNEDDLPF